MDLHRLYGNNDELLYVGISYSALVRQAQHQRDKPWWREATRVDIEHLDSMDRDAAAAHERDVITRTAPKYNVVHNAGRRRAPADTESAAPPFGPPRPDFWYFLWEFEPDNHRQGWLYLDGDNVWVTYFSWWDGTETNSQLIDRSDITSASPPWKLYADHASFIEATEKVKNHLDRKAAQEERQMIRSTQQAKRDSTLIENLIVLLDGGAS